MEPRPLRTMRGRPLTTINRNPYLVGQIALAEGLLTLPQYLTEQTQQAKEVSHA